MTQPGKDAMLVRQAKAVLDFNWTGEYTMPGPRLYPHQWSWDSALIAIAYSRYDQDRAVRAAVSERIGTVPRRILHMVLGELHFKRQFSEQDKNGSFGGCAGCSKGFILPIVALEVHAILGRKWPRGENEG